MRSRSFWISLGSAVLLVLLVAVVALVSLFDWRGECGGALEGCDPFKVLCATYDGEHQFFYSECDLLRENCWTGKVWKRDYISHCNVYH